MKQTTAFRNLMREGKIILAPGAYDGMTAKLVEGAGFPAVYMTGAGTAATHGYPDFGLLTMTEMVANAATLARSVNIPVIADADTGYGGLLNVHHTVRAYEDAGVAAIQIEDQEFPKKCGHTPGRRVVPLDAAVRRVAVAAEARRGDELLVIARTDARTTHGLGFFTNLFFRWLFVGTPPLHFSKHALALHLLFQHAERLIDIVIADKYLQISAPCC